MLEFKGLVDITIDLENGVYIFDNESGTGKTFLCKQLKIRQVAGEPVVAYTNEEYVCGVKLRTVVDAVKPKVIFLDRVDLYGNDSEVIDVAREYESKAVVLVDKKHGRFGDINADRAGIDFEMGSILVI